MPKKKYSVNWENDEPVSFEVDGVEYERIEDVPDEADREKLGAMMDASFEASIDQQVHGEFDDFDQEFKKNWEAHKKNAGKAETIILSVFTGVAVLMLSIAFLSSASAILKMNREENAPGRVVEIVHRREYVNEQDRVVEDYYYPVVEYTAKDGRRHTAHMTEGSSVPLHEVGDEVTVLYNPERPLEARIRSLGSYALMWILPGITGTLGLCFLGAVIAVKRFLLPEEDLQNELA